MGYGSGGDVKAPYKTSFATALKNQNEIKINGDVMSVYEDWCAKHVPDEGFWGHWPYSFKEMPVTLDFVRKARESSNVAFVVIGRSAGEDREQNSKTEVFISQKTSCNSLTKSPPYLKDGACSRRRQRNRL